MMISAEQIKAARAMLDWTQDELARACGLSLNTVSNLEKGHLSIRSSMAVRKALEDKGFEFFGKNGLCRRSDESRIYEGSGSCDKFYEDMLAAVKDKGGEIAAVFWSQEMLAKSLGAENSHQLERLEQLARYAKVKCLLIDVLCLPLDMPFFEFRTMTNYHGFPFAGFTHGDKTAIVLTKGGDFTFFVAQSVEIAQTSLREFAPLWDNALPLAGDRPSLKRRA
jgi:transcriptional regulator with XRE-family HTH domain